MWFYKLYCWLYALLALYTLKGIVGDGSLFSTLIGCVAVLIGVFLFVFGGIGLFLYAYDKKWLPNVFWKIFAVIELASQVLLSLKHMELLEAVIVLLILSPLFIALFRLGYGKKAL